MARDDWSDFLFRYSMLENRGVRVSDVAVTAETQNALRDEFTRRFLVQSAQFDALAALGDDVRLLSALTAPGAPALEVPALAYFLGDGGESEVARRDDGRPAALAAVRQCVEREHGPDFLAARVEATTVALRALRPEADAYAPVTLSAVEYPPFKPAYSSRYLDLFSQLQALRLLQRSAGVQARLLRAPAGDAFVLDTAQAARLAEIAGVLRRDLCALSASSGAGSGSALLIGMARLAALDASLERGRWVLLDVHVRDARTAPLPRGEIRERYLDALETESAGNFARRRDEFLAAAGYHELGYAAVEDAGNRLLEARAARAGAPLRLADPRPLPLRAARRDDLVFPRWDAAEGGQHLAAAEGAEARLGSQLEDLYAYDLIRRNCVSEIFDVIAAALPDADPRRLGGHVTTSANLNFIPIASAAAVETNYRVVEREQHASYRQTRIERMAQQEASWRVRLRESNTLTSEAYRPGVGDSEFLFFTQDEVAPRPILGVANVVWALGQTVAGVITAPLEGSGRVERGVRGVAFSLPELVFVNLRKGTNAYATR